MKLYCIDCSYYCAGLEVEDGVVTRAAPILKWTVGKDWAAVSYRLEVVHGKTVRLVYKRADAEVPVQTGEEEPV